MIERDITEVLADLPKLCALENLDPSQAPIMVKRGETGYWSLSKTFNVTHYNETHGITDAQQEAMRAGSHFGFHVPGADPLNNGDET